MADGILTPCNVARSWHLFRTLQCDMWLWNCDSEFTKWQHPAMWYVALGCHAIEFIQTSAILEFGLHFDHISPQSTCHSAPVSKSDHPRQKKNDVMSIFKMADLSHLGFYGSNNGFFWKAGTTSYKSSIDTIALDCLAFWENRVFCILATDRQTNRWTAPMH